MDTCKHCNQPFLQAKPWQQFCCQRCQQDWHLHQRKLARQEKLLDKLASRDHGLMANGNGHGTPEQRQKAREEARMVIDQMVARAGPKLVRRL
jgi:hypothetical protein